MSLATIANSLYRFVPGLQPDLVRSTIQDSYRQLCSKDWTRLRLIRSITTVAPYTTGTVSVAADGTVTGVGTTFTSSMVGAFMRVYYGDSFFEIATYTSETVIVLRNWTGQVVSAGTSYTIFRTIYSTDSLFGIVYNLNYQTRLKKRSQAIFNRIDPGRLITGSSPISWAYAGQSSTGVIQVEVYPVPSTVISIRVHGKVKASTLGESDSPILPEDLVEAFALLKCYQIKAIQQPKQGWEQRAEEQKIFYADLLDTYEAEDRELDDHESKVKDAAGESEWPTDDTFAASHDVEW